LACSTTTASSLATARLNVSDSGTDSQPRIHLHSYTPTHLHSYTPTLLHTYTPTNDSRTDSLSLDHPIRYALRSFARCSATSTSSFEVTNPAPSGQKQATRAKAKKTDKGGDAESISVELSDLYLGLGNVINLGTNNILSINIGDGASQCVGDGCTAEATRSGNFSALPDDGAGSSDDPMKPAKLDVDVTSSTSTVITWEDASASPPDAAYTVNCVLGSEDTECTDKGVKVKGIKGGVQKATITGLSPGTDYSCWVQLNSVILNDHCSATAVVVSTTP